MPDAIKLPGLNLRRLWKVTIVDNIDKPTKRTVLLIRKCETAFQVMNEIKKTPGWVIFQTDNPDCSIMAVELAGVLEN